MNQLGSRWVTCPICQQLVISNNIGRHSCHPKIKARFEKELDIYVHDIMQHFNESEKKFRSDKQTKFYEFLAENDEI